MSPDVAILREPSRLIRLRPPTVTIGLLVAMGVVFTMTWIAGGAEDLAVQVAFGANFGPLVADGDLWRLVTSIFLHANLLHIALNGWALFILGRNLEAFYGAWRFLALFLLSGVIGAVSSALFSHAISVGASGGIFGLLGASVVFAFRWRALLPGRVTRVMGTALLPWVALNLVLGVVIPHIDIAAHVGGLVGGALLALVIVPDTMREARGLAPPVPRVLGSLCVSLLVTSFVAAGENLFAMRGPDGAVLDPRVETELSVMGREEALQTLDEALAKKPEDAELLRTRGDVRAAGGEWGAAVADYRAALKADPKDAGTLNNLAWLLLEEAPDSLRNVPEAERLAAEAAAIAPDDPYVVGTWGAAKLRSGDVGGAIERLEKAVAASRPPRDEATDRYLLAVAYAQAGRGEDARASYLQARREDAGNRYRVEAESALAAAGAPVAESQAAPAP